ncbi:MAG TPA: ATP-binding protein [Anaerolineales bacterium]
MSQSDRKRAAQTEETQRQVENPDRLNALYEEALLDTPSEASFDRLTRLATLALNVPVALVSLVDRDRQFFKSSTGLPEPWATWRETPLSHSFCQHTIGSRKPLIIEDARRDPLVRDNLAIQDMSVIAYAGIPLLTSRGEAIGSMCAIDTKPRSWTDRDIAILQDLAAAVMSEIELRQAKREAEQERHRAEKLAVEQTAILRQIVDGVMIVDVNGSFVFVNEAARRLLGRDLTGGTLEDWADMVLPAEDAIGPVAPETLALTRAVFNAETTVNSSRSLRRPDGTEIVAEGSATPLYAEDGTRLGAVLTFHDVTHRAEIAQQKDEFLSAAAHDLKSPLTTIKGLAQLVLRQARRSDTLDAKVIAGHMERIEATSNRMANLMTELLDATRIELGRPLDLVQRPTDLVRLVQDVVADHEHALAGHEISLHSSVPSLVGQWDALRLQQVVTNLITNAIKYSPEETTVELRIDYEENTSGGEAVLRVADTGIGIPEEDLPRIFDRFYRASNVAKAVTGSGIGLAGVRQIVDQHGGTIEVQSREGEGSTFIIRLPLQATEPRAGM